MGGWLTRRRALIAGCVVVALLALVPLTAYVIIPAFVRSTVVEAPPSAVSPSPGSGGSASPTAAEPKTLARGDLKRINTVDFGSGTVLIVRAGTTDYLRFENVEIAAAPAQHVYLSDRTDGTPGNFTDLGALKATSGSFNYAIPQGFDVTKVRSVVSWCLQFKTTVTYALIEWPG